jgi:hypothetical protein
LVRIDNLDGRQRLIGVLLHDLVFRQLLLGPDHDPFAAGLAYQRRIAPAAPAYPRATLSLRAAARAIMLAQLTKKSACCAHIALTS